MPQLAIPPDFAPDSCVVVAVSGGADSVALLDLLVTDGRFRLVVWHLDHALRSESADDAAAVIALAQRFAVPCVAERIDARAHDRGDGIEEAGRRVRYERLIACCHAHGAVAACTAHHRDDQAETALLQILRGCGPEGPVGMADDRELAPGIRLLRPLLATTRAELHVHCRARGLPWRDDASNVDQRFRRNYLRHTVLPEWERHCPGIAEALVALAQRGRAARSVAERAVAHLHGDGGLPAAELLALAAAPRAACWRRLLARLAIPADRNRLRLLNDLLVGPPGRRLRLGPWLFLRRGRAVVWNAA